MVNGSKFKLIAASMAAVICVTASLWLAIPTVALTPADASTGIIPGTPLVIDSSVLSSVGKISVTVDGKPALMEYNLETGDVARDLDLKPGQEVRVETKVASVIGITREFVSTFMTVEPVVVGGIEVNGSELSPGEKIPAQPTLRFLFNKQVSNATLTLDGGDPIDLAIDEDDHSSATMTPVVSLKQGVMHVFKVSAQGAADGVWTDSQEIRAMVVKPLSLYGKARSDGDGLRVELDSSVAFNNPSAVRSVVETSLPGASVTVDRQKIIIVSNSVSQAEEYTITVGGTEGEDGSFLEGPLLLTLGYKAGETQIIQSGSSGGGYRGYNYPTSPSGGASGGATGGSESGPPPGWPPCCPWPPR